MDRARPYISRSAVAKMTRTDRRAASGPCPCVLMSTDGSIPDREPVIVMLQILIGIQERLAQRTLILNYVIVCIPSLAAGCPGGGFAWKRPRSQRHEITGVSIGCQQYLLTWPRLVANLFMKSKFKKKKNSMQVHMGNGTLRGWFISDNLSPRKLDSEL